MEFDIYKSKPLQVEAIYYDGTEENAQQLCQLAPESFLLGEDKSGRFSGLFINIPGVGISPVLADEIIYRELGSKQLCSMNADGFNKYFKKAPKILVEDDDD